MKTPLQEIIGILQDIIIQESNDDKRFAYGYCVYLAKIHLECEKDAIIDAFRYGNSNEILGKKHPEQYYNEVFNNKE